MRNDDEPVTMRAADYGPQYAVRNPHRERSVFAPIIKMIERVTDAPLCVDFRVQDERGRQIGTRITWGQELYAPMPEDELKRTRYYRRTDPGVGLWYFFEPRNTRDGQGFGAGQKRQYFRTASKRNAAVARYIGNARARYVRNAAKRERVRA